MLLKEFSILVLIPLILANQIQDTRIFETDTDGISDTIVPEQLSTPTGWDFDEDFFSSSSNEIETQTTEIHTTTGRTDPLLAEIDDEVRRLELEYPDDYFDHLDDRAEHEVRKLIKNRQEHFNTRNSKSLKSSDEFSSTIVPILIPSTTPEPPTTELTTKKPLGSIFTEVKQEAGSIFGKLKNPFQNIFGTRTTTSTTTTTTPIPAPPQSPEPIMVNLNCTSFQVVYKGNCHNLFRHEQCKSSEWLVEDSKTQQGKCVNNPCHDHPLKAPFGNLCISVGSTEGCQEGMRTYLYKTGVVACDCKERHLYNERNGRCYKAYTQGPCSNGQHFIIPKQGAKKVPTCLPNPCIHDGYFCDAPKCPGGKRGCKKLGEVCGKSLTEDKNTNETKFVYEIDQTTYVPYCTEKDDKFEQLPIIGNVPTLSCAPGSRRDILGNCRTPTVIEFT